MIVTHAPALIRRDRPGLVHSVGASRFGRVVARPRRVGGGPRYGPDLTTTVNAISGGDFTGQEKEKAFDDNWSSFWGSSQLGSAMVGAAYIGQNFGVIRKIRKVSFWPAGGFSGQSAWAVQRWDGSAWQTEATIADVADGSGLVEYVVLVPKNDGGTQWRLLITATTTPVGQNNPIAEIEMREII